MNENRIRTIVTVDSQGNAFYGLPVDAFQPVVPGPQDSTLGKADFLLGKVPGNPKSVERSAVFRDYLGFQENSQLETALEQQFRSPNAKVWLRLNQVGQPSISITSTIVGPTGTSAIVTCGWTLHPETQIATLNTAFGRIPK